MSLGTPRGLRLPWAVIRHAVWLYARFTPSPRDVEAMLAERGIVVSHEAVPPPRIRRRDFRAEALRRRTRRPRR